VNNAFAEPQTIVLLGGTSDIGLAIVRRLLSPSIRHVVLGCRQPEAAAPSIDEFTRAGAQVTVLPFDATKPAEHAAFVHKAVSAAGDIDVAIIAFGVLGDQATFDTDPVAAADAVTVNYTGAVSAGLAIAERLRTQGHGRLVVLSSVAGERARKANFVYGSTKAGVDAYAQGLGDSLQGSGAGVLVVRPGFVHSKMTAGMTAAPFAATPEAVAEATVKGLRRGAHTVWAPPVLRPVFSLLRHVPRSVFRRLPLG
jgi:decaprenylphospho-beta-D-erythro-pentofuranosid-2-ulose 2-reductase